MYQCCFHNVLQQASKGRHSTHRVPYDQDDESPVADREAPIARYRSRGAKNPSAASIISDESTESVFDLQKFTASQYLNLDHHDLITLTSSSSTTIIRLPLSILSKILPRSPAFDDARGTLVVGDDASSSVLMRMHANSTTNGNYSCWEYTGLRLISVPPLCIAALSRNLPMIHHNVQQLVDAGATEVINSISLAGDWDHLSVTPAVFTDANRLDQYEEYVDATRSHWTGCSVEPTSRTSQSSMIRDFVIVHETINAQLPCDFPAEMHDLKKIRDAYAAAAQRERDIASNRRAAQEDVDSRRSPDVDLSSRLDELTESQSDAAALTATALKKLTEHESGQAIVYEALPLLKTAVLSLCTMPSQSFGIRQSEGCMEMCFTHISGTWMYAIVRPRDARKLYEAVATLSAQEQNHHLRTEVEKTVQTRRR